MKMLGEKFQVVTQSLTKFTQSYTKFFIFATWRLCEQKNFYELFKGIKFNFKKLTWLIWFNFFVSCFKL